MTPVEDRFANMALLIGEACALLNARGVVVAANQPMFGLLGQRIANYPMERFIRHQDFVETLRAAREDGRVSELSYTRTDKLRRQLHLRVAPFEREHVLVVIVDKTDTISIDRIRSDFVANVSHELRSPLSAVSGFIETLRDGAGEDRQTRDKFLAIMQAEAERMQRLIDDLLSLSRVEAMEHHTPNDKVDLHALLEQTIAALSAQAMAKQMRFAWHLEAPLGPDACCVLGMADELRQVFQNLIENAIRYGDAGSVIELGFMPEPDQPGFLRVEVLNQGPVIEKQDIARLTERFYRIDAGRARDMGGTGLGLAIVKHIVNRHQGRLRIASSPENTRFCVTLRRHA
ncbi:MAG: two-component sensor histidine kinase [Rhodobiaceae bacterium]|nr:two-component sensor histidine kinase [Rhodobiaceae bacterium]